MSETAWPHFADAELNCRCCGAHRMAPGFMARLERLRVAFGKPLALTSAYRCPEHNAAVSGTGRSGPHTTGQAVDIPVKGGEVRTLIALAIAHGFTGIGLKQKGPHAGRFVHLDDLPDGPGRPRPWVWTY